MDIAYDTTKRNKTLKERNLDFADFPLIFEGFVVEKEDDRKDYGETRIMVTGVLRRRVVVAGYTMRGKVFRVFSLRKASEGEKEKYAKAKKEAEKNLHKK